MRRPRLVVTLLGIALLLVRPAPAPAQSVASLVTSLPASFAHLFEPTNGLIVAAGGGVSALLHPQDDDVARHYLMPSDSTHTFFRAGHVVGDTPAQSGADFWQHNIYAGYRFPKRHAELRIGVANLLNRNYQLNPLNLYAELPRERAVTVGLKLNF